VISTKSLLPPQSAQDYSTTPACVHLSNGPCCDTIIILLQFYVLSRNSYIPSYSHITRKNYKERVREMQVSNGNGELYNNKLHGSIGVDVKIQTMSEFKQLSKSIITVYVQV